MQRSCAGSNFLLESSAAFYSSLGKDDSQHDIRTLGELLSPVGMASWSFPIRLLPCARMACMSLFSAPILFMIDLASPNSPCAANRVVKPNFFLWASDWHGVMLLAHSVSDCKSEKPSAGPCIYCRQGFWLASRLCELSARYDAARSLCRWLQAQGAQH